MKAVVFREHGGPEVLQYVDLPAPEPKRGEVLIRLRAAALNWMDVAVRKGWAGIKLALPHVGGADGAGEIAGLGPGTDGLAVGDHVVINANLGCGKCRFCLSGRDNLCSDWHLLGESIWGTYAEFVCVQERQVYKLPSGFAYQSAAAAALVYQTAWHSLVTRGELRAGETVLIVGAGGGVNSASIQVAKLCGATVMVVASSAKKAEFAASLGADTVIDRSQEDDWSRAAFLATDKAGVDVVVDNVGTTFMPSLRCLRKGGRLLTVGSSGGPRVEIDNRYVFYRHLSVIGSTMSPLEDFRSVMDLVTTGKLQPALDSTFPLRDASSAHRRLEGGKQLGKITLDIG